jgi:copper(I)-binding protein
MSSSSSMKFLKCAALALGLMSMPIAFAASSSHTTIRVRHAWIRWLPNDLPVAGYMTIDNDGDRPVDLVGESSPDYGAVMLHRTMDLNGVEHMEMVSQLTIPGHGKVAIAPGGYHLMLMHARHAIKPGDDVHLTLRFSNGDKVQTHLKVRPATQLN